MGGETFFFLFLLAKSFPGSYWPLGRTHPHGGALSETQLHAGSPPSIWLLVHTSPHIPRTTVYKRPLRFGEVPPDMCRQSEQHTGLHTAHKGKGKFGQGPTAQHTFTNTQQLTVVAVAQCIGDQCSWRSPRARATRILRQMALTTGGQTALPSW